MGTRLLAAALLAAGMLLLPPTARAAAGTDFQLPNGHFYSEANGRGGGPGESGFAIVDSGGIPFWTAFVRGGGIAAFGYPISRPFPLDGFTDQAMQKAIFQWDGHAMAYLNVLDFLHREGKDGWLEMNEMTPPPLDTAPDTGLSWPQVVARHQQFLDSNAALRAAYFAASDFFARYGLPLTPPTPEANGAALVVRCQRAVLQLWLTAQPWAAAGQVTVANAGDLAKAADVLPFVAVNPQSASSVSASGNFTLTDLTSGKAVSAQQHAPSGRASAEWIVQIPIGYDLSTMPPAPPLSFTAVAFTGASAVIGGVRGAISNPAWQAVGVTMVSPTGAAEAVPSPLSTDGSSFQVTWRRP